MMTPYEFYCEAAQWGSYMSSGDPGACMYGFTESGCVQSEEHRRDCIAYIDGECRAAADLNVQYGDDPDEQHPKLDAMREYLLTAPVAP